MHPHLKSRPDLDIVFASAKSSERRDKRKQNRVRCLLLVLVQ